MFCRTEPSPPVISKSMIWSNQSSGPHTESPQFGRPMGSSFPMDHGAFGSNLLNSPLDPSPHMDVGLHHQRMIQSMPINQFLTSQAIPDRMAPMFAQQPPLHPQTPTFPVAVGCPLFPLRSVAIKIRCLSRYMKRIVFPEPSIEDIRSQGLVFYVPQTWPNVSSRLNFSA